MIKRNLGKITVFFLYVGIVFLVGCADKLMEAENGGITLNYYTWTASYSLKLLEENLAEFEKEHPQIRVELINIPADATRGFVKLKTMLISKTSPDVMVLYDPIFAIFSNQDVFMDLTPFISGDTTFQPDDFFPQAYQFCQSQGKQLALPRGMNTYILYYNKNLFDIAGMKYPDETWTWDTFLDACKKLTKDTNNDGQNDQYGFRYGGSPITFIWQNGGDFLDPSKTRCMMNRPEAVEAIQFVVDLMLKYKVSPKSSQMLDQDVFQAFMSGKIGMIYGGRFYSRVFQDIKTFDWDVAPPPIGKQRATLVDYTLYVMSKHTKHPKEAWELMKFLAGPKVQERACKTLDDLPVLKSVAYSPAILDSTLPPANVKEFLNAIEYSLSQSARGADSEILDLISTELDLVYMGNKTTQEACDVIQRKVDNLLAERKKSKVNQK